VSWTGGTAPFIAAISTSPAFTVTTASGVAASPLTYSPLDPNTTYYFKVQSSGDTFYSVTRTTSTRAATPTAPYFISSYFTAESSYTAGAQVGWLVNGNPEWTRYDIEYADNAGFTGSEILPKNYPPVTMGGLNANTTYYFRVRARGVGGTATAFTADISTATLALKLPALGETVYESSVTVHWTSVNDSSIQALKSEGYRLHLSTTASELITPASTYFNTADAAAESVNLEPLDINTTYYYRAGTLNWNAASNLSDTRRFTTLGAKVTGLALVSVTEGASLLSWTALSGGEAMGYRLEASSSGFSSPMTEPSSTTYALAKNSLAVSGLNANTTYYFRASSLNQAFTPNYTAALSSITLASPPSANLTTIVPQTDALTVFLSPLPAAPQNATCEGYRLEVSSTAFGGTGVLLSSVTFDSQAGFLSIGGLKPNTLYNLRLGTLNWAGTPNYSALDQTLTLLPPAPAGPALGQVWQSSATVYFSAEGGGDNYLIEASTYQFFNYVHRSSATPSVGVTTLTVSGLEGNTRYYFRAGALYGGTTVYANTTPAYRYTLPLPLVLNAEPFPGVFYSSATMAWTPLRHPELFGSGPDQHPAAAGACGTGPGPGLAVQRHRILQRRGRRRQLPDRSFHLSVLQLRAPQFGHVLRGRDYADGLRPGREYPLLFPGRGPLRRDHGVRQHDAGLPLHPAAAPGPGRRAVPRGLLLQRHHGLDPAGRRAAGGHGRILPAGGRHHPGLHHGALLLAERLRDGGVPVAAGTLPQHLLLLQGRIAQRARHRQLLRGARHRHAGQPAGAAGLLGGPVHHEPDLAAELQPGRHALPGADLLQFRLPAAGAFFGHVPVFGHFLRAGPQHHLLPGGDGLQPLQPRHPHSGLLFHGHRRLPPGLRPLLRRGSILRDRGLAARYQPGGHLVPRADLL